MPPPAWLVLAALVALPAASLGTKTSPESKHEEPLDYYAKPKYDYKYGVEDFKTGDHKSHWEKRDGDQVTGAYTVMEPDGTFRTVTYTANKDSGFNAVVTHHGKATHPQPLEGLQQSSHSDHPEHAVKHHQPEHAVKVHHPEHVVRIHHPEHVVKVHHPEHIVKVHHPEHSVKVQHPEHAVQLDHPVQIGHAGHSLGTLHRIELVHQQPELFEHKGESTRQVHHQLKRPLDADAPEVRALSNAIPPAHYRVNPAAKPAPFKQQHLQLQAAPAGSSSSPRPRQQASKQQQQPGATSAPAPMIPSYFPGLPAATSPPKLLQTSPVSFPSAFSHSSLFASVAPLQSSDQPHPTSPPSSRYGKQQLPPAEPVSFSTHSSSFLGMSTPTSSGPGRPARPHSRTGDGPDQEGDDDGFVPETGAEHARIYRHGTQDESQRSFVEVGLGGYPDTAYEYVDNPQ